ncbi:MAG: hypothetical protein JKP98_04905 [Rhodobacteraceae bacterium]|nr:hypothetical protein [Paracoccaceae bacterium]
MPGNRPRGEGWIAPARPLHVYTPGLLRGRVRRILQLAGWAPRLGLPGKGGTVGVWACAEPPDGAWRLPGRAAPG